MQKICLGAGCRTQPKGRRRGQTACALELRGRRLVALGFAGASPKWRAGRPATLAKRGAAHGRLCMPRKWHCPGVHVKEEGAQQDREGGAGGLRAEMCAASHVCGACSCIQPNGWAQQQEAGRCQFIEAKGQKKRVWEGRGARKQGVGGKGIEGTGGGEKAQGIWAEIGRAHV